MKKIITLLAALLLCIAANAQSMREQAAAKDHEIAELRKQLAEKQARMRYLEQANLMPAIIFDRNSAIINPSQYAALEMIAKYANSHPSASIEVRTFASIDESNTEKLCEDRANNVISRLISTYKVKPTKLKVAIFGKTDQLYESTEFNRIVTFNDNNR